MFKKLFAIALLYLPTIASHSYFAERNMICELCKVYISDQTQESDRNDILQQYPQLLRYIPENIEEIQQIDNYCHKKGLCMILLSDEQPQFDDIVKKVNNAQTSWVAEKSSRFENMSMDQIKSMMGTIVDPEWAINASPLLESNLQAVDLPEEFDTREAFPYCKNLIGRARDQSNCGSCWAHGTTEAFNDRLCIKTQGQKQTPLSTADTTACCGFLNCMSQGCNGGQIGTPWTWFTKKGVVTGGDFGDNSTCYPYTMPICAHHIEGTKYPACTDVKQVDPKCDKKCSTKAIDYNSDKVKAASSYSIRGIDSIKNDIMQYGTVTAAFTVYEDFVNYKSGVYRYVSGKELGGHAIKIIGWGKDHWICVNSWNETWGDNGLFKIAFGQCGIDSQVHAGRA